MTPDLDLSPRAITRGLLRKSRSGALATLMPDSGNPYCSLVNVATLHDGSPLLLISKLAVHTKNILNDSRVSLMLDERSPGDPLEGARIMISGHAEKIEESDQVAKARQRYLAAHPSAEVFVNFGDFGFSRVRPNGVHMVAGFGRIVDLKADDVLTDLTGADDLIAAEADVLEHMNADHADTMDLYATKLLGAEPGAWRATGCDPDGLDMQDGSRVLRLEFPQRVETSAALRKVLKELADRARAKAA